MYIKLLLPIFLFLLSCKDNTDTTNKPFIMSYEVPEPIVLKSDKMISAIEDTVFFKEVNLTTKGNNIVITDSKRSRFIVTDTNFKLKYIKGQRGSGPGELKYAQYPIIIDTTIFISDQGNMRVNVYGLKSGSYIKTYRHQDSPNLTSLSIDNDTNFYFGTQPYKDKPSIMAISKTGDHKRIGEIYPYKKNPKLEYNRNYKHVVTTPEGLIIAIGWTIPFIDIYDKTGKKLVQYDLSGYKAFKDALLEIDEMIKKDPDLEYSMHPIILGAYYRNGRLYLSLTNPIIEIFEFEISTEKCLLKNAFSLDTDSKEMMRSTLFFVDEKNEKIYIQYVASANIHIFKLPK